MRPNALGVVVVAGFLLASCGGSDGTSPPPQTDDARQEIPPEEKPEEQNGRERDTGLEFAVETFDGATFRLSDHRGTPVVLNFWESW